MSYSSRLHTTFGMTLLLLYCGQRVCMAQVCRQTPERCQCMNASDSIIVNCSRTNQNDSSIAFPTATNKLFLDGNVIQTVTRFYRMPHLKRLVLSGSRITIIVPGAFDDLPVLTDLDLSKNPLRFFSLPQDLFGTLTLLKSLDISRTFMYLQLQEYPHVLFSKLDKLQNLTLDGLNNTSADFGVGFSKLTALEYLTIYANITHISNTTLAAFRDTPLKSLSVWSGWLDTLESHAFADLTHLEILDLSYNPRLGFDSAAVSWPGLSSTNISTLILDRASSFETSIVTLEPTFFYGLEATNITKLVLDGNNMVTAHALFSQYLPQLQHLSLSRNRLVQVNSLFEDLHRLRKLTHLDGSHQAKRLFTSEQEILAGFPFQTFGEQIPQSISVPDNGPAPIQTLGDQIPQGISVQDTGTAPIETLGNQIAQDISAQDPGTAPIPLDLLLGFNIIVPDTLEYLLLSGSLTIEVETLPKTVIYNGLNLRRIEYAANGVSRFDGALILANKSNNPITLDLSDNDCSYIDGLVFDEDTSLSFDQILLSKNKLNSFFNDAVLSAKFVDPLKNLRVLDLKDNGLKSLPRDIFRELVNLEVLNLSSNALRSFPVNPRHLPSIRWLDLSENLISVVTKQTTGVLTAFARNNKDNRTVSGFAMNINLVGNPFVCSCKDKHFIEWIYQQRHNSERLINFLDFDQYYCVFDSEERTWNDDGLRNVLKQMETYCNRQLYIILGTVLPTCLIIVISLSICMHRHRWEVRFWLINIVMKKKEELHNESRSFAYDAFVAYHESNVLWVKKQMLTVLEQDNDHPLKLCVHHRDFPLGHTIEENIVQSIKESRKTILLISKEFIKSSWCYFEMQMARITSFDEGRDVIIAILLEPISPSTEGISQTLLNILRKQTYIVWPQDPRLRDEFWQRLREAIQSPRARPTRCECGKSLTHDGYIYKYDGSRNRLPRTDASSFGYDHDIIY